MDEYVKEGLFYVVQKAFIKNGNDILVLNDPKEGLDYPGGKIQKNEDSIVDALKREVLEETGISIDIKKPFFTAIDKYPEDHKHAGKLFYIVFYECEFVSGEVSLSSEHNNFSWVNKDNYKKVDDGTWYFDVLKSYLSNK